MRNNYGIKHKITVLSVLQIVFPMIIVAVVASWIFISTSKKQMLHQMNTSFNYITQSFASYSDSIYDISEKLLCDTTIFETLSFDEEITDESYKEIENTLRSLLLTNNDIVGISFTLEEKNITVSKISNGMYQYGTVGYNEFVKNILIKDAVPHWELDGMENGTVNLCFGRTIENPYTDKTVGTMIIRIKSSSLYKFLDNNENKKNANIILMSNDMQHKIVSQYNEKDLSEYEINKISSMDKGVFDNEKRYIYFQNIPVFNIKMIYLVDSNFVYSDSYKIPLIVFLLVFLSMILVAFFVKYINASISIPIHDLSHTMRHWNEDLEFVSDYPNSKDEIGTLYSSFDKMTKRIETLIDKEYKAQIALKESELEMLQNQINPHFLFNTLETINSMSVIYDVPQIGEIITTLSDMFEDSVHNGRKFVTLEEELVSASRYLYIMNLRYENRFNVIKNISKESMKVYVPKFILQPIIENSIKHGLLPLQSSGTIEIYAQIIDKIMVIKVTDYGVGIEDCKVKELNDSFINNSGKQKNIGLSNVNRRLKLYYGAEYNISVESKKNEYTTVTLKIPIMESEENHEIQDIGN